jgi:thymidylate synthase
MNSVTPQTIILTPRSFGRVMKHLYDTGDKVAPRGLGTYEVLNASLLLKNPIDRLVPDAARCLNIPFCFAEWASMMFGLDNVDLFTRYIKNFDQYSADKVTLDGAYGARMHPRSGTWRATEDDEYNHVGGWNGMKKVIEKLTDDPLTRRAVLAVYDAEDINGGGGLNTPCILTIQFIQRDNHLHAVVNMRANDATKGTCNDIVTFSMLQEYIARQMNWKLGSLVVNAASFHLYESDVPLMHELIESNKTRWPFLMNAMPRLSDDDLAMFKLIAIDVIDDDKEFFHQANAKNVWSSMEAREYVVNMASTMKAFLTRYTDVDTCLRAYDLITDRTVKHILRHWLRKAKVHSPRHLLTEGGE